MEDNRNKDKNFSISRRGYLKEKYNDRFLLRLVSSYSFLLVIILILGMLMYYYGMNNIKKDLLKENQVNLEKAISDVDSSFKIMSSFNSQIANSTEIVKLMQNNTVNYLYFLQAWEAKKNLQNLLSIQNMTFFEDVFLYFYETDYILSANEFENSSLYYQFNKRYNEEYYSDYIEMLTNPVYFGKPQSLSKFSNTRDDFLLYTYPMSIYRNYSRAPVTICYRIDKTYFEKIFSGLNIYETGFIYIKDGDGKEILRLTAPSSLDFTAEELNLEMGNIENTGYITINHENMVITQVTSNNNLWTYYLIQPSSMVFHDLAFFQKIYWAVIVLVFVLGLFLLVLLSWKNLKPIKQIEFILKNSFAGEENTPKIKDHDVMYSIDHYVNLLIDKKVNLQATLEHQRPIIFSAYLARLMKGLADSGQEMEQIAKALDLNNKDSRYLILYLGVYLNELEFYIDDFVQNKNSFQEIIREVLERNFEDKILIYEADFQSYAILIRLEAEDKAEDTVKKNFTPEPFSDFSFSGVPANCTLSGLPADCFGEDIFRRVCGQFHKAYKELKDDYSLIIYGGISEIFTDLLQTWQACQHALEALRYAGPEQILQLYKEIKKDMDQYVYPIEMEGQVLNFITNGKENQVQKLLKNIFQDNFVERSLSITMSKWLLSDLRNTLLKIRFMLPEDTDRSEKEKLDEKFGRKKSFELIEEIAMDLCRIFEARLKNYGIIEQIQEYIRENFMDSSLSLSKISQEFDISESYFSYLFKKVTCQNFSEYLEKIRIMKAINLLQVTELNVNEIAEKVGYTNCVSFRRAFKRVYGTNPAALRSGNSFTYEG